MSWTIARGVQDNYRPPLVAPEIVSPLQKACWHPTYPASLLQNPLVHGPLRIEGQGRGRHNPVHHCLLDIERHASSSNSAHTTVQKTLYAGNLDLEALCSTPKAVEIFFFTKRKFNRFASTSTRKC